MYNLLQGKIALVTGAGRGIGQAIARRIAEEGAIVYANGRRTGVIEEWTASLPQEVKDRILSAYFDLTDRDAMRKAIQRIRSEKGRIDVLVNNAGIAQSDRIGMIASEQVAAMFDVNVFAILDLMQLVIRLMQRQQSGSIINIASIVGIYGDAGQTAYAASKGAVIALTRSAAKELAPCQIRVNAVAPGLTETDMYKNTDPQYLAGRLSQIGMKRIGQPQDIANACVFLASDLSSYISGQVLGVDGCSVL